MTAADGGTAVRGISNQTATHPPFLTQFGYLVIWKEGNDVKTLVFPVPG